MANISFGIPSINKPTPASLNRWVRTLTVVIGIFLAWMNTNTLISDHLQSVFNSIGGLLLALINGLAPLWGINVSAETDVPVTDIKSMETPKT